MKFAYTILYVTNVTATIEFYENAFGFQRKFITPEGDYAELVTGETTISFASEELANSNLKTKVELATINARPFGIELAFTSENIKVDFEKALKAGAILEADLITKPWGQTVGYLRDINGFLIEVCTPMQQD